MAWHGSQFTEERSFVVELSAEEIAERSSTTPRMTNTRRHLLRLVQKDDEFGWNVPHVMSEAMDKMFDHGPDEEKFIWSPEPLPYVIGQ
jgi:hypothetical protein